MAYELKEGQGSLFRNAKKEKDSQPDYTGRVLIGGIEYRLAGWLKDGASGKWMSLQASLPDRLVANDGGAKPGKFNDLEDDIPF